MKEKILELRKSGHSYNDIQKVLKCSKSTISYHCGSGQKEKNRERMRMYRAGSKTAQLYSNKYTDELIQANINGSTSISGVLRNLGLSGEGGWESLRKRIKIILIQSGTYKGQGHNKGVFRVSVEEIFTKNSNRYTTAIRDYLFTRKLREKKCESCEGEEWLGNKIPLEVHHIDGDKTNNELNNLQILCPNCHYFTDTYKGKNIKPS